MMRSTVLTAIITLLTLAITPSANATGGADNNNTVSMLCVGNSATKGSDGLTSYRYDLFKRFVDAGTDFEFIGTQNDPNSYRLHKGRVFDPNHEGHALLTTAEMREVVDKSLKNQIPDVVFIHLGRHDINPMLPVTSARDAVFELEMIVQRIQRSNPAATIFLAQVLPFAKAYHRSYHTYIEELNRSIPNVALVNTSRISKVAVVDQNTGFDDSHLLADGIHPNPEGAARMADNFANAYLDAEQASIADANFSTWDLSASADVLTLLVQSEAPLGLVDFELTKPNGELMMSSTVEHEAAMEKWTIPHSLDKGVYVLTLSHGLGVESRPLTIE